MNNGGSAFPVNTENTCNSGACFPNEGMTMRDYFAAKAMAALITDQKNPDVSPSNVASWAYRHADAMLAEREKGQS